MIEGRRAPVCCRVAQRTICRETRRHVIWIRGPGEVRLMAAVAGH